MVGMIAALITEPNLAIERFNPMAKASSLPLNQEETSED
jgi:hypothetical protein